VSALAGLGRGLTPEGDDVLAGYAGWRSATCDPVLISGRATGLASPIGLAYLRCAERGELPDGAARLVAACRAGDTAAGLSALPDLRRWGSTSGAAVAWGIGAGTASGGRGAGQLELAGTVARPARAMALELHRLERGRVAELAELRRIAAEQQADGPIRN
jgi:Protein of unknown function (DUF2877)